MESRNSTFKMPVAPGPPISQAEALLFNDILEEKSIALRNNMMSFLQVLPYRKFDIEFAKFLKHTQNMALEGQRTGANISRLTNLSQISSFNPRPSTSFQCRQSSTGMSLMSNNRNSSFRPPENIFQPVEPYNPFSPSRSVLEPRVVVSRIDQSRQTSNHSQILATVIEVSHNNDENKNINHDHENVQLSERSHSPTHNGYSNVTMNEDMLTNSQQNINLNDGSNSVESLLDSAGFKIIVGLPENYKAKYNANQHQNSQLQLLENVEMFLSKWSVNMKIINSPRSNSKVVVVLTGTLLSDDKVTVLENHHDAGILAARKELTLVRTSKGLYRLIGNIIGGSPNDLYQTCLGLRGVPKLWKKIIKNNSNIDKGTKNMSLNFTLDSPAGPIKPVKSLVKPQNGNLNTSMTRNGKPYNKYQFTQNVIGKRKSIELGKPDNNKNKRRKIQSPPLIASTPKRQQKNCMYDSPSQMLKNKLHQKMHKEASVKSTGRTLNLTNDSINITKNRRALSKEQVQPGELLKPKSPSKSLLTVNNKHCSQVLTNSSKSSVNSSKMSKEKTVNSINNSFVRSQSIRSKENYSTATPTESLHSFDLRKSRPLLKSSINISKNSMNDSEKSKQNSSSKNSSKIIAKVVEQTKQKKNTANNASLFGTKHAPMEKDQGAKAVNIKPSLKKDAIAIKKKSQKKANIKEKNQDSSSVDGLFPNVSTSSDVDFRLMSPGKLSAVSHGDGSRSETPPLFNNPWASMVRSTTCSNPPTPMSKSMEAKALKRIKAPKLSVEEELRNDLKKKLKKGSDFKTTTKKINQMLEFGADYED